MSSEVDDLCCKADKDNELNLSLKKERDLNSIALDVKRVTCFWLRGYVSTEDFIAEKNRLFEAFRNASI